MWLVEIIFINLKGWVDIETNLKGHIKIANIRYIESETMTSTKMVKPKWMCIMHLSFNYFRKKRYNIGNLEAGTLIQPNTHTTNLL